MLNLGIVVLLVLLIGSVISILSKRFNISYAKLLIVVGLLISIVYYALGRPPAEPTGELIISIILPPLIFQAALTINYSVFKKVQRPVILLERLSFPHTTRRRCSDRPSRLTTLELRPTCTEQVCGVPRSTRR